MNFRGMLRVDWPLCKGEGSPWTLPRSCRSPCCPVDLVSGRAADPSRFELPKFFPRRDHFFSTWLFIENDLVND